MIYHGQVLDWRLAKGAACEVPVVKRYAIVLTTALFLTNVDAYAQSSNLPATERMLSCDRAVAKAAAREVLKDPDGIKEPLNWFAPAMALFRSGEREEALFWFYAAQLRTRYQLVFEQGDRGQLLTVMLMTVGGPINNFGYQNPELLVSTYDHVLKWDQTTPNPWRNTTQTAEQRARVSDIYEGFQTLRQKVLDEAPTLKAEAQRQTRFYEQMDADRCRPGRLDPSMVKQARRAEQKEVERWVRWQTEVREAIKRIDVVSVDSSELKGTDDMPSTYHVFVNGERELYVDVDVSRTGSAERFYITCLSTVPFARRDMNLKCQQK